MVIIQNSKYLDFLAKLGIGGAHPGGINLTKAIFKKENINRNSYVLDVGCGTGQTAAYLAYTYGAKVTGIDINPTMVAKAEMRMKKNRLPVTILQGSVEKTSLPNNHFDFIVSESVLAFVNQPVALKEIFRLLKDGGRFIAIEQTINEHLKENDENEIKQFYGFTSLSMEKEWVALFTQAGFEHIRIEENTSIESVPEIHYSDEIDAELYEILDKHSEMMMRYKEKLGYRIYSCTK